MMEPHMIGFPELASSVGNYIIKVFVLVTDHVDFMYTFSQKYRK